jgi:hypothetical protein
MEKIRPILKNTLPGDYVGAGTVTTSLAGAPYYTVNIPWRNESREILATRAAGLADTPGVGDRVLCVSGGDGAVYITLLLEKVAPAAECDGAGGPDDRAGAATVYRDGARLLEVRDRRGELIFEYDPGNDRSRIIVNRGTLDISAPEGDIRFNAGGRVHLQGSVVELSAGTLPGTKPSRFSLGPFRSSWLAPSLDIRSGQGRIELDDVDYRGKRLISRVARARLAWGRLESLVDCLVQKARTSFTTVEELSQTKAGRMRTLVAGAFRMKAERASLKTGKNFDIDGERINIG